MARLLIDVTRALADRAAVDWNAAVSRAGTDVDRQLVNALRGIEILRTSRVALPTVPASEQAGRRYLFLMRSLLALALAQVACSGVLWLTVLASHGAAERHLPQILLAFAFASGSVFLATCATKDQRTLYLAAWFACGASAFARHAWAGLSLSAADPMQFALSRVVPEAFMAACVWQFAVTFPRVRRFTRFDMIARRAAVMAWLLGSVLFAINLVGPQLLPSVLGLDRLLRGHPDKAFWHVFTLAIAPAIATVFVRARRAHPDERRKVARLAAVIAIGSAPYIAAIVLSAASPRFNRWLVNSSPAERFWLDAIVVASLMTIPILSAIAVVVDRPFELRGTLASAWRHAGTRGAVELVLFAPVALLTVVLYNLGPVPGHQALSGENAWLWGACALAMGLALRIRKRVLRALDRRISHRAREHHYQLVRALERVRMARGTRELSVVLQQEIIAGTGATTVTLLLPSRADTFTDSSVTIGPLPRESALVAMLRVSHGPIDVGSSGSLRDLLPHSDLTWVDDQNVALLMPVKHRDDAFAAVLVLGPKRRGVPFDNRDLWFVTSIAAAAAAAWTAGDAIARTDGADHPSWRTSHDEGEAAFECPACGSVVDSLPMPCPCAASARLAALPQRVGDHLLVTRRIGAGGMGVVYLARDVALDRDVALKTLPTLASGAVTQLEDEARAMAALNHPSLATIYGLERCRRTPILVVEYFPDGTLADRLTRGPLAADEAVRLGITMAAALSYMHAHSLLHRDLKPSNIGMTATGAAKLLDFGLASLVPPPRTTTDGASYTTASPIGTLAYLPPEVAHGAPASPAVDLWALAVVVLECLTGTHPFAHDVDAPAIGHAGTSHDERLDACLHAIDGPLRPFFERALAHDPHRRFQRAETMQSALEAAAAATPS